jgi:hypothetical protein
VAITKANGKLLTPEERLDIYLNLQETVGIQHGDSLSWLQDGELLSSGKTDLLKDHLVGGEPLAVFDPTGAARVNFINPKLTFFNAADKAARIWYVDGHRTPLATASHLGQLSYPMFSTACNASHPWLSPLRWGVQILKPPPPKSQVRVRSHSSGSSVTSLGGRCTWTYSNASPAGLAYPDGKSGLKVWSTPSGWHELNLDTCWYASKPSGPLDTNHVLRLLPQSSL